MRTVYDWCYESKYLKLKIRYSVRYCCLVVEGCVGIMIKVLDDEGSMENKTRLIMKGFAARTRILFFRFYSFASIKPNADRH